MTLYLREHAVLVAVVVIVIAFIGWLGVLNRARDRQVERDESEKLR